MMREFKRLQMPQASPFSQLDNAILGRGVPTAVPGHVESIVIAGLDPAIHPFRKKMDARVKPAHDGGERRFNSSGPRCSSRAMKKSSNIAYMPRVFTARFRT
jgi:hypothetical protein